VIKTMEITAEGIGRDAEDLLRKVKAAQYVAAHPGEVCPAKWKEGEAPWLLPGPGRQDLSLCPQKSPGLTGLFSTKQTQAIEINN
jgi:hypothetical protein